MTVTIYHNPRCSKSRQTLELIRAHLGEKQEPVIIEYLKTPPATAEISAILRQLGISPRELIRKGEQVYKDNNLTDESLSDEALIEAMAADPVLIERPVVITEKGAHICRPPETVKEIL